MPWALTHPIPTRRLASGCSNLVGPFFLVSPENRTTMISKNYFEMWTHFNTEHFYTVRQSISEKLAAFPDVVDMCLLLCIA